MKTSRFSALASCVSATVLIAGAVQAQDTPTIGTAPSAANNSQERTPAAAETTADTTGGVAEIVVTANKRAENLQKVAASVSAVSQASLFRQGVKEIADITRVIPEVQIQTGYFNNITIAFNGSELPEVSAVGLCTAVQG